jgi:hypothetical protein
MNGKVLVMKSWCETEIESLAGKLRKKYAKKPVKQQQAILTH